MTETTNALADDATAQPAVRLEGVTKKYGAVVAVE